MNRRRLIAGALALVGAQALAALPAMAATFVEQIVVQLKAQGFKNIEVETTWLGRAHIQAERADVRREIVLNPNTGEILRDLSVSKSGSGTKKITISDDGSENHGGSGGDDSGGNSGSGSGSGSGGSGGGNDDDDDDDDDEESGHGGSGND